MVVLIIGVSGCGKSTVARMLADTIGMPYYDADDFHPKVNVDKMRHGEPLNDRDREFWLKDLSRNLQTWEKQGGAVLACSALKEKYRKVLATNLINCRWVHLSGSFEIISQRMKKREDHYMGAEMLKSQFDILEVPDYGLIIDIGKSPKMIVKEIKDSL